MQNNFTHLYGTHPNGFIEYAPKVSRSMLNIHREGHLQAGDTGPYQPKWKAVVSIKYQNIRHSSLRTLTKFV